MSRACERWRMTTADLASNVLHVLFAGLWTGAVVFVTWSVLPLARDGDVQPGPVASIVGRLRNLSRLSALVLLLTGGHMAGTGYEFSGLIETTRGNLVLAMVALWLVLIVLVEVAGGRFASGLDAGKLREPARNVTRLFQLAAVVALGLLVVAGALAGGL